MSQPSGGVSIRISGGLGNQMFQYAAARALALRLAVPLTLDLSFYDRARHRGYGLDAFKLASHAETGRTDGGRLSRLAASLRKAGTKLSGQATPVYEEPHFHHDPAFDTLRAPIHLIGHFQSPRYFEMQPAKIRAELAPPAASDPLSQEIAAGMAAHESCALHVRRGDYLSNPKNRALFAVCDERYHAAALARLPAGCTVYVFSDEMPWARVHLPRVAAEAGGHELVFVDDGQPRSGLADLWLMTRARHHVIANSSLSWWGAWLAGADKGLTLAPTQWFVDSAFDTRDLVPKGWVRV